MLGLRNGRSFATHDVDAAQDSVGEAFGEHRLRLVDRSPLDMHLNSARGTIITVGSLSYGADVTISTSTMEGSYHINLPVQGSARATQGSDVGTAASGRSGIALTPSAPLHVHWSSDCVQYSIRIPVAPLVTQLSKLLDAEPPEPPRLDLQFDVSSERGRSVVAAARFLRDELSSPEGLSSMPVACGEFESSLLSRLLYVIPHQYSERLEQDARPVGRSSVRRALALIEAHPDRALDGAELARAAGVSPRALQEGFRIYLDSSPMAYLRSVRLERVHAELLTGEAESVTEVAMKWRFYHLGRFAQQYRRRFGTTPSATLREARLSSCRTAAVGRSGAAPERHKWEHPTERKTG
jgi:AraC-like DNA-binding protein